MLPSSVQSSLQTAASHLQSGRTQQGVELLLQLAGRYPNEPRSRFMLGFVAQMNGDLSAALDWLNQAIRIDPTPPEPYYLCGVVYQQQNRLPLAIEAYRACLSRRPGDGKALNNLGRAMYDSGDAAGAIQILRQAVEASPKNAGAVTNLGNCLRKSGDIAGAMQHYLKAIAMDPNCGEAHGNLGIALYKQGNISESEISIRRAIAINQKAYNPRFNLARLLQDSHRLDEAMEQCRIAVELWPTSPDALNLMGNLHGIIGQVPECIAFQSRALEADPGCASGHSNLLLSLHYLPEHSPQQLFAAHRQWATRHIRPITNTPPISRPKGNRRLRVGYLSPNFNNHSVAYFFEPVLAAHDRNVVEVFCYSDFNGSDDTTQRLKSLAENWREISGQTDDRVMETIRADQIDILVDLAGHTAGNRLPTLGRRPAPVQMTWIGYPGTTGMTAIDYRLTDPIADPPPFSDELHTEKLVRIPGGCWAYQPPASAPPVGPSPAVINGFVTFGSFNNLPKVTPQVVEAWSKILQLVPGSRLILKATGFSARAGREHFARLFSQFGIDLQRIELISWAPTTAAHLQLYDRVDIALDTFPYNGTTTTCEALWMGVPVIAFAGDTHVSRVSTALLTHAGLTDWIADSVDGYINLATRLAIDIYNIASIRQSLREKLKQSSLCDGPRLALQLEEIYLAKQNAI